MGSTVITAFSRDGDNCGKYVHGDDDNEKDDADDEKDNVNYELQ